MTRYRLVMTLLLALGVAYLAAHMWVAGVVWAREGWLAGIVTFLAAGFADAYWTYAWWNEPGLLGPWYAAAACALASLVSLAVRPFTRPYMIKLGVEEAADENGPASAERKRESVHHEVPTASNNPHQRSSEP